MFGPHKDSSMYDNPYDTHSSEWKRWNWEAQQKREAADWENLSRGWGNSTSDPFPPTQPSKPAKNVVASPKADGLDDNDKVVFGLAAIAAFFWITHEIGSANWIAGVIGGLVAGYVAAKTYKVVLILIALYVGAMALGYHHP